MGKDKSISNLASLYREEVTKKGAFTEQKGWFSYKQLKSSAQYFIEEKDSNYSLSIFHSFIYYYKKLFPIAFISSFMGGIAMAVIVILKLTSDSPNPLLAAFLCFFSIFSFLSLIPVFIVFIDFAYCKEQHFCNVVSFKDYKSSLFYKEYRQKAKEFQSTGKRYTARDVLKAISPEAYETIFKVVKRKV